MENRSNLIAIISHLTIIGWVVALILNQSNRSEFSSFYIRQSLGIFLIWAIGSWIPFVRWIAMPVGLILLIISLVSAVNNRKEPSPFIGHLFQKWFAGL